jgi:hypothetical protein
MYRKLLQTISFLVFYCEQQKSNIYIYIMLSFSSTSETHHRSHHHHKLSDSNVGHKLLQKMGMKIDFS